MRRVVFVVLDGVGAGAMPDAAVYGDAGANTLGNVALACGGLVLPNLHRLGLGNAVKIAGVPAVRRPLACFGTMSEKSPGKDTTTGHWELMGVTLDVPFRTYPDGFPEDVISRFQSAIGREVLGNKPASGTVIIEELGPLHIATGKPIVYTSADSVFQIAAHEEIVSLQELYEMCKIARRQLVGENMVARVIARPFTGSRGSFRRTPDRKDFSIEPIRDTVLDCIVRSGGSVHAVGKIQDIFAGRGVTSSVHTADNADGIEEIVRALARPTSQCSLIMANLVDFDMLYGHRNDVSGFAGALCRFDTALPRIITALQPGDLLFITADHGCDPTTPGTDHSREYVPVLVYSPLATRGKSLGLRTTFADAGRTVLEYLGASGHVDGTSLLGSMGGYCDDCLRCHSQKA